METAATELNAENARKCKLRQRPETGVQLTERTQAPNPALQRSVQQRRCAPLLSAR